MTGLSRRSTFVPALLATCLVVPALLRAQTAADSTQRSAAGATGRTSPSTSAAEGAAGMGDTSIAWPVAHGAADCPPGAARDDLRWHNQVRGARERGVVVRRQSLHRVGPVSGRIRVAFEVDTLGRVDSTSLRMVGGKQALLRSVAASVGEWRFRPAELAPGCVIRQPVTQDVNF